MGDLTDTFWGTRRASAIAHLVATAFGGALVGAGVVCFWFAYQLHAFGEITNFAAVFTIMGSILLVMGTYGILRLKKGIFLLSRKETR